MSVPVITVTSEGKKLPPVEVVRSLQVRRDLNRVPEAELVLADGSVSQQKFELSDEPFFEPGKKVKIDVRVEGADDDADETLFEGLVVRHAVESRGGEMALRVELKDAAFKLTRKRKSAVFRQKTDDAAIQKIVKDAGLETGQLETTSPEHAELVQHYATDWDFIVSRADAQGMVIDVDRGKVSLRKMVPSGEPKATFEHGLDEVDLDLELDGGEQWAEMSSQGWDPTKLAIGDPSDAKDPKVEVGNLDPSAIAKKLGGDKFALMHPAVVPAKELSAWANARLARSRLALLRGQLSVPGRADLAPLDQVKLKGVGERFDGKALISGVTHSIQDNVWKTELRLGLPPELFTRQPDIVDVLAGGLLPAVHGLHLGTVGEFEEDDGGELRVKVQLSMLDSNAGAVFARCARPDAGKDRGIVFWPEKGDEVIVGFLNGDPRQAVILGSLHGSKNTPPELAKEPSKDNYKRAIVTKKGTVIAFDDEKKSVKIETPGKNRIVIDDDAKSITVEDENKNKITLDKDGIVLKSAKDFTIDAASGKVVIKGSTVDVK